MKGARLRASMVGADVLAGSPVAVVNVVSRYKGITRLGKAQALQETHGTTCSLRHERATYTDTYMQIICVGAQRRRCQPLTLALMCKLCAQNRHRMMHTATQEMRQSRVTHSRNRLKYSLAQLNILSNSGLHQSRHLPCRCPSSIRNLITKLKLLQMQLTAVMAAM